MYTDAGVDETTLGIYSGGDIQFMADDLNVAAQIFSDGSIRLKGNAVIYGSLTARGHVHLNEPATIYYRPASSVLTEPIWPVNQ